jgi:BON domain
MKRNMEFGIGSIKTSVIGLILLTMVGLMSMGLSAWADSPPKTPVQSLEAKVHHVIVMEPFYTVFDNVQYTVNNDTVTLTGQVMRPILKSSLEKSIAGIVGVSKVVNHLEVLPLSHFDDTIRWAEYRTLYSGNGTLSGYSWGPVPAIHIIVNNGHVTLTGVVNRQVDKDMATLRAGLVPNVFSVDNQLTVKTP